MTEPETESASFWGRAMEGTQWTTERVGMGLRLRVSYIQMGLYIILVMFGILGNAAIVGIIGTGLVRDHTSRRSSDMILVNMAFSNLMVSVTRNILLIMWDLGVEMYTSRGWCMFLMGLWVWLRSVNVWSTLFLSAFHFRTLRRVAPISVKRGPSQLVYVTFGLIWSVNLLYSIPAFIFSTRGDRNSTESLMLVSSTTRPLLGCTWDFPSVSSGLAYATISMVIHESLPIIMMTTTNVGSLLMLYTHRRSFLRAQSSNGAIMKRVPVERRAAKVILALNMLFITSWGTSMISINYFNYNRGPSTEYMLVIARFANTAFIAFSPFVLAVGHRHIRGVLRSLLIN
ncbi:hypothetical protein ACEWY4_012814 [Coilia grayii]|uniref:Taste receptor type 2 n=1 Tax=Coilia grayii TaxID=363190 RepID=A0ABD1JUH6_9TELE